MMDAASLALLFAASLAAGAMNATAGGGSFLTFPALVLVGVPPIVANATSTVALVPGSLAGFWAYRHDFKPLENVRLGALVIAGLLGGATGAVLLLLTPQAAFSDIVPWLLLAATSLFCFGRPLARRMRSLTRLGPRTLVTLQYLVGIYGGYFGGAVSIVVLAMLTVFGLDDINRMNAIKNAMVVSMNLAALACFAIAGTIWWLPCATMAVGAIIGGYTGGRVARRIPAPYQRAVIITVGIVMTIVFFTRR